MHGSADGCRSQGWVYSQKGLKTGLVHKHGGRPKPKRGQAETESQNRNEVVDLIETDKTCLLKLSYT